VSQPPSWCSVSNTIMERVRSVAIVTTALLALVLSAAAEPCPSQGVSKSHHAQQGGTGKGGSQPCDETSAKQVESEPVQEVSWDPVVCWGCPMPEEDVAFFFVGLILCAPISLWILRARTRKRESALPHRFLE
jgi:hypothetical protein